MACGRGQSSVEYLAVVAIVALVLGAAAAVAGPTAIGKRFVAQWTRALCVVGGGRCDADLLPCATGWRREARSWKATVSLIRLGGGSLAIREERSDGTVAITKARNIEGGLEYSDDFGWGIVDLTLRGALLAGAGSGQVWVLPDRAAADRFERAIEDWKDGGGGREPDIPPATVDYEEATRPKVETVVRAVAMALGGHGAGGELSLSREDVSGVRHDRATGHTTLYARRRWSNSVTAQGKRSRGGDRHGGRGGEWRKRAVSAGYGGRSTESREVAVTLDAAGRPVSLVVIHGSPGGALPSEAAEAAALLPEKRDAQFAVLEQHLDLTDPVSRRVAHSFLARERGSEAALREHLREQAVMHVRAYRLDTDRLTVGAKVGKRPWEVGGSVDRGVERARLVGAITRDLGGSWIRRGDCRA